MSVVQKRTFSLPAEQSDYVDAQVAAGGYASASEVVRAGLRALQERDAAVDRWLREEAVPVYDAMQADPARAIPAEQVFEEIRAEHATHMKRVKRGP
jgi:antitoxin ParD1/3/4